MTMSVRASVQDGLLSTILTTVPVGVFVIETETLRFLLVNEHARRMLEPEWHGRDLTLSTMADVFGEGPAASFARVCAEVARTGEAMHIADYPFDGFTRGRTYWDYDLTPLHDEHGWCYAVMLSSIETTAHVRAQQRLQETNAALVATNELALRVNATKDLPTIFQYALDTLVALLHLDQGGVGLLEYGERTLRLVADHSDGGFRHDLRVPLDDSFTLRWLRDEKRPLAIEDVEHDRRLPEAERALLRAEGVQSALFVPILVDGVLVCTIGLDATNAPRVFTADEIALCETVSNQLAVAIRNARLHEQMQARMTELATLNEVSIALAGSLALEDVLNRILREIARVVPYDAAFVALPSEASAHLRVVSVGGGRIIHERGTEIPIARSIIGRVFRENVPALLPDLAAARDWLAVAYRPSPTAATDERAVIAVPLRAMEGTVGVLYLARDRKEGYTDSDLARLLRFTPMMGVAITNAHLYTRSVEHATQLERLNDELKTLREVGIATTGTLDLPAVLRRVLVEIARVVPFEQGFIALEDPDRHVLHIEAGSGTVVGSYIGLDLRLDHSLNGHVFARGETICVEDFWESEEWLDRSHRINVRPDELRSILCAPLRVGGRSIGTIYLAHGKPAMYRADDIDRIERYAAQVAIAVANARLYGQVRRQVEELRELNAELEAASQHKSEFLATMSHELRTPLNAIIGFSELLHDDIVLSEEDRRECLGDILTSAKHLLRLINDVLDVAKVEAGRMDLHPMAFTVADELREVERMLAPLILANQQTLSITTAPALPSAFADRARFRQIILNVLSNANKFTPSGGRIVVTADGEDEWVRICVADTGIGIRAEDAPKVFEAFRQIDGSLSRRYNGSGLGLALTKRLVELQGGTIDFTSEVGVGTIFTITLPAARAGEDERLRIEH